jgi:hypothetical protein
VTLTAVPLVLICALVLAAYLNRTHVERPGWALAFAAFAIRVVYVAVDNVLGIFAGYGDASAYDATFRFVAGLWESGVVLAPLQFAASPGNDGYYMLLYSAVFAPAYVVLGSDPVLPRFLMSLFGTLVVVNVYLIARQLATPRAGLYAGGLAAVFPYWIVYSGLVYRDMFVVFLFSVMGYFLVRWQTERSRRALALAAVFAVLGVHMRIQNIVPVGALAAAVVFTWTEPGKRGYAAAFVGVVVAGVTLVAGFGQALPLDRLVERRLWLARPNDAAYLTGVAYDTGVDLLVYAPIGALYFALTPFLWQPVNMLAIVSIAQNLLLWYPAIVLAVLGVRNVGSRSAGAALVVPLLVFSIVGIVGYGLVEGNIGPAMRHRMQFQFVFFVFAGIRLASRIRLNSFAQLDDHWGRAGTERPGD